MNSENLETTENLVLQNEELTVNTPNVDISNHEDLIFVSDKISEINDKIIETIKDETDKKIAIYLISELEKKNFYINELEEVIKDQENKINELNEKISSKNQVDLLLKIKDNLLNKSNYVSQQLKSVETSNKNESVDTISKKISIELDNSTENVDENNNNLLKIRRRALRRF
jgi:hypothetical protein